MGRGKLTEEEIKVLKQNPFVSDAGGSRILYTNEFKYRFMEEYLAGKKPTQIFRDAGFNPKMLGSKRIERATQRWKESYNAGTLGSYQDATIRNKADDSMKSEEEHQIFSMYLQIMEKQREQIKMLQDENRMLKRKLEQKR